MQSRKTDNNQNLILFTCRNIVSGSQNIKGCDQFPNPPNLVGVSSILAAVYFISTIFNTMKPINMNPNIYDYFIPLMEKTDKKMILRTRLIKVEQ